jgi:hypothetical protein
MHLFYIVLVLLQVDLCFQEFRTWFPDTSVVTYGSVAELKDEDLLALPLIIFNPSGPCA